MANRIFLLQRGAQLWPTESAGVGTLAAWTFQMGATIVVDDTFIPTRDMKQIGTTNNAVTVQMTPSS